MKMEKMFLVNPEEYASMKKKQSQPSSSITHEPNDIQLAKLQDAYVRKRDEKKIKENLQWNKLSSRLKPILSSSQGEIQGIIDQFPPDVQSPAKFIVSTLSRLPKVLVTPNRILIDGIPMKDSLLDIIADILQNNVSDVETLIRAMRNGMRDTATIQELKPPINKREDKTPEKQRAVQESSKMHTPSPVSNPERRSPIKTRSQHARMALSKIPARSPKVRFSPLPQKVSHSPALSKVRHSPVALKVQKSPKEEKKNDGGVGYWYNFD